MVDFDTTNYMAVNNIQKPGEVNQQVNFAQQSYPGGDYERMPMYDTYQNGEGIEEQRNGSPLKKIFFGSIVLMGLAAGLDFIFAKGRHVKKLFGIEAKNENKAIDKASEEASSKTKNATDEIEDGVDEVEKAKKTTKTQKNKEKKNKNKTDEPKGFWGTILEKLKQFWQWLTKPFRNE